MRSSTEEKCESCKCICLYICTQSALHLVAFILLMSSLIYSTTFSDNTRLKLESLSVRVISSNTRAAEWNAAFSITDDYPKTNIPNWCRGNSICFRRINPCLGCCVCVLGSNPLKYVTGSVN